MSRNEEVESPEMISEMRMRKYVKFQDYGIILSLHGPNTRECISFYLYSALNQDTYLTNKYNHFKKTGGCITTNNN